MMNFDIEEHQLISTQKVTVKSDVGYVGELWNEGVQKLMQK